MDCEKCQNLISVYLDGELDSQSSRDIQTHFSVCGECAKLHEDFASIVGFCGETFTEDSIPPNSQALWCRINNIIESDVEAELATEEKKKEEIKRNWFSRIRNSRVQFSPSQMITSFIGIALISSLLTVIGIKNFSVPRDEAVTAAPTLLERGLAKIGLFETTQQKFEHKLKQRREAIAYWKKRVETRRNFWNAQMREAFDRNLNVIDKSVSEYTEILQEDPQDSISSEMLDSALNEKMELMREFSEL
ncbi:MAG: anti-sigma factor family protein [Aridibacter sp.]